MSKLLPPSTHIFQNQPPSHSSHPTSYLCSTLLIHCLMGPLPTHRLCTSSSDTAAVAHMAGIMCDVVPHACTHDAAVVLKHHGPCFGTHQDCGIKDITLQPIRLVFCERQIEYQTLLEHTSRNNLIFLPWSQCWGFTRCTDRICWHRIKSQKH